MADENPSIRRRIVAVRYRLERPEASLRLALGGFLLGCALLATAAELQRPTPVVGTETSYTGALMSVDCPRWTTGTLTEDGLLLTTCQGYTIESDHAHDMNPVRLRDAAGKTLVEFKPYTPSLSFPLSVGKRWRGQYTGFTAFNNLVWDGETTCKAEAEEKITVPAGEFDTLRIECENGWRVGPKTGSSHATRWYAPAIGAVVKEVHARDPERWNFELAHYGLPGLSPAALPTPSPAPAVPPAVAAPAPAPTTPAAPPPPEILDPNEY